MSAIKQVTVSVKCKPGTSNHALIKLGRHRIRASSTNGDPKVAARAAAAKVWGLRDGDCMCAPGDLIVSGGGSDREGYTFTVSLPVNHGLAIAGGVS